MGKDNNQRVVVDIEEFKSMVSKNQDVSDVVVHKQMTVETKMLDEDKRIIRFIASTGTLDRDSDTIDPMGWDLTDFRKNPVVQWCHDYTKPPLGNVIVDTVIDGKLIEDVEFINPYKMFPDTKLSDMPEWMQFIEMVYRMYKGNFMHAVSVGFIPKQYKYNPETGGMDFSKQSKTELSLVPVPANQEALRVAGMKGIDTKLLKGWAKGVYKSLDKSELQNIFDDLLAESGIEEVLGGVDKELMVEPEEKPVEGLKINVDISSIKEMNTEIEKASNGLDQLLEKLSKIKELQTSDTQQEAPESTDQEVEIEVDDTVKDTDTSTEDFIELNEDALEIDGDEEEIKSVLESAVQKMVTQVTGKVF